MDKLQAYNSFWNSFGVKAYDETSVPYSTQMPYITYEMAEDSFGNDVALTANVWDRSSSWVTSVNKVKQIEQEIGRGGKLVKYDEGAFWIRKATPWARRMQDDSDDSVRRILMNIQVEFID